MYIEDNLLVKYYKKPVNDSWLPDLLYAENYRNGVLSFVTYYLKSFGTESEIHDFHKKHFFDLKYRINRPDPAKQIESLFNEEGNHVSDFLVYNYMGVIIEETFFPDSGKSYGAICLWKENKNNYEYAIEFDTKKNLFYAFGFKEGDGVSLEYAKSLLPANFVWPPV